ncbi:MAG: GNAT family N-acetyltransferase [Dysgonamonadaceae bacterium]
MNIEEIAIWEVTPEKIPEIVKIAREVWPITFGDILTSEQIDYMMNRMYSEESLLNQLLHQNHRYFLAGFQDEYWGYISIEHHSENSHKTKIHKAYIHSSKQGGGIGRRLFDFAANEALKNGDKAIYLNVNKYNTKAIAFYEKYGMSNVKSEIIDIGNGYIMDDFVYEKLLK